MRSTTSCAIAALCGVLHLTASGQEPPPMTREFRGVWVTTVGNTDWPSKPGLSTWDQQQELLAILDRATALGLNAIIFHIRPGGDAFYASPYEPWSQYLTGRQGRAPEPPWDPLQFAVDEAHKRGLELHAWFNPFRAAYIRDTGFAATHIVIARPDLVRTYGRFLWMDPGSSEVRRRALRAMLDVVKRYDVDGVHLDDYFYPYPDVDASDRTIDFPDTSTYAAYLKAGGRLGKADWRRANVDSLVAALYRGVHAVKPWVKVGISPFGIWRPGNPTPIRGLDAYNQIYADSRLWLEKGWADYFAPQLYWSIRQKEQSFPELLDWWLSQDTQHRHIWPGLADYRVGDQGPSKLSAQEIVDQIDTLRSRGRGEGHIHFTWNVFTRDPDGLDEKLAALYRQPALVPASPWLDAHAPSRPSVRVVRDSATGDLLLRFAPAANEKVWLWTVRTLSPAGWTEMILPGWLQQHRLSEPRASKVVVTAVSRTGVESLETAVDARVGAQALADPGSAGRRGGKPNAKPPTAGGRRGGRSGS